MYEDRLLQVQEWWLSDRLYILKDRPAVFGNPDYQMNSSSVQKQLKAAGIDTNSKKYKAVLSEMMKNGNGAMFTNVQAIKNLMSQYDKNGDWIDPNTGLTLMIQLFLYHLLDVTEVYHHSVRIQLFGTAIDSDKIGRAHV